MLLLYFDVGSVLLGKMYMAGKAKSNSVRIIAGQWRSRRIDFPDVDGLRPTHDRIRETLFNWLSPSIVGATCLDFFCGSGALGFEALSRGAAHTTFVDASRQAIDAVKHNADLLSADAIELHCSKLPDERLHFSQSRFDIVFLDPPFEQGLVSQAITWLQEASLVDAKTLIYFEVEKRGLQSLESDKVEFFRLKKTKSLAYGLLQMLGK
jgi:16S rRNA (guanine966-N2)-methyltransferase